LVFINVNVKGKINTKRAATCHQTNQNCLANCDNDTEILKISFKKLKYHAAQVFQGHFLLLNHIDIFLSFYTAIFKPTDLFELVFQTAEF
jgi:hypothetical protein